MISTIIGYIAGFCFEFDNTKSKEFPFFHFACSFTDDSVMTMAMMGLKP